MKNMLFTALFLFFAFLTVSAGGALVVYNFPLEGSQEVPPVITAASGVGLVTLDTVTNELQWEITYSDLSSAETNAHFHGPAPIGANAGAQIALDLGTPKIGSQILTEQQKADVLAGLWYVNIHTEIFPGGELRGQVIPEPVTLSMLGLGGLVLLIRRSHR